MEQSSSDGGWMGQDDPALRCRLLPLLSLGLCNNPSRSPFNLKLSDDFAVGGLSNGQKILEAGVSVYPPV